jgi:site-specific recombinase XerD
MTFKPHRLPTGVQPAGAGSCPADAVAAFLELMPGTVLTYRSAAQHFLLWLKRRRVPIANVDAAAIDSFAKHRCHCPRYSAVQLRNPVYINRVRRFVRFLEDRGDISLVEGEPDIRQYLPRFAERLLSLGYCVDARRVYYSAAEHFTAFVRASRICWRDVDATVIDRFAEHRCSCALRRKSARLVDRGAQKRRHGAHHFLDFLRENGAVPIAAAVSTEHPRLGAFRVWLKHHRGVTDAALERYFHEVQRWLPTLGLDPAAYDAAAIRNVVLSQSPSRSIASVRNTATVLRAYLRFLAARGECRAELAFAVPPVPRRRLAALPRYASAAVIERIIASCDVSKPSGLRDRAILLLLARLGLRAGDIRQLRIADIDWRNAVIRVCGKGRRGISLPLPQDAGDAVLDYIERARPVVAEDRVFLRVVAPFTTLAASTDIAGIVARAVKRAGVDGVPTGAHMFRHSLATAMLRSGASLEGVGAVLRHRSPNTTAIYAKVDVAMLLRVAQPWPGDAAC